MDARGRRGCSVDSRRREAVAPHQVDTGLTSLPPGVQPSRAHRRTPRDERRRSGHTPDRAAGPAQHVRSRRPPLSGVTRPVVRSVRTGTVRLAGPGPHPWGPGSAEPAGSRCDGHPVSPLVQPPRLRLVLYQHTYSDGLVSVDRRSRNLARRVTRAFLVGRTGRSCSGSDPPLPTRSSPGRRHPPGDRCGQPGEHVGQTRHDSPDFGYRRLLVRARAVAVRGRWRRDLANCTGLRKSRRPWPRRRPMSREWDASCPALGHDGWTWPGLSAWPSCSCST